MPGGMDMSALEGVDGTRWCRDMFAREAGMSDMSQMFGGGLKGKIGEFCHETIHETHGQQNEKAKKTQNKKRVGTEIGNRCTRFRRPPPLKRRTNEPRSRAYTSR